MTIIVDVEVVDPAWLAAGDVDILAQDAIAATLVEVGKRVHPDAEISVRLCDDDEIRALNLAWRNKDKATNVLSFPSPAGDRGPLLGDIVVAFEYVSEEARDAGRALRDHLAHMLVHGMLHLLGFDHENESEAEKMEAFERRILAKLGIDDPYSETVPVETLSIPS
ncbi:MAG: putative rRNA maturation factor [Methylobacteriaceae bacterium]|nr:putative rRNA maturation factor [Methylobacteriaceae bacterium]